MEKKLIAYKLNIQGNLLEKEPTEDKSTRKFVFTKFSNISGSLSKRPSTEIDAAQLEKVNFGFKQQETEKNTSQTIRDRFYLPVLYINDPTQWPSKELTERQHLTDELALKTCIGNCCGQKGLKAGCCYLDPDNIEHVLGPLDEPWINDMIKWFTKKGIPTKRSDFVIDFEEGRLIGEKFFNNHDVFRSKESYPILRFQVAGPRFACKFLNIPSGFCEIYEKRPSMCSQYFCQFVKANFLVRTKEHPNRYVKIR